MSKLSFLRRKELQPPLPKSPPVEQSLKEDLVHHLCLSMHALDGLRQFKYEVAEIERIISDAIAQSKNLNTPKIEERRGTERRDSNRRVN